MQQPRQHRRVPAFAQEAIGAVLAVCLAVTGLRHVVATARVALLWYDGDSVLLPLVVRSVRLGEPFEWAMSPALFFFPELPVYALCALVTATPQQALAVNGLLVVVAVYALLRAVANELMRSASRSARIAAALLGLGVVSALVLTESSATATSLELASLLFTSTYYYGTLLAMLATTALILRVVRRAGDGPGGGSGGGAGGGPGDGMEARPTPTALVTLGLLAAFSTTSNPLYVPWSAGPVVIALALLTVARRVPWRISAWVAGVLAAGSAVGYLLRVPLRPFVSLDPSTYVHPDRAGTTLSFFAALTDQRAGSAAGDAGLLVMFCLVLVCIGGTVWAWRARTSRTVLVATTIPLVTVVAVSVGVVVAGSETPRYLEPVVTAPLVALVAVCELARTAVRRTRVHRRVRGIRLAAAVGGAFALVAGVAVAPGTAVAVTTATYGPATCLDRWAAGRDVVGVGQFWTVRPLATYASDDVRLLQVRDDFSAYPWLVNLGSYRGASPTYVLVGSGDLWSTPVEDSLGRPASITHCSGYDVYDYAGTRGADVLRHDVRTSAGAILDERGF